MSSDHFVSGTGAVLAFQVCSIFSAFASFLVVFSALIWETFASLKRKIIMQILILISLCDMFGSIGAGVGFQRNGSDLCYFQSSFTSFFWVASWFWQAAFSYQLYCIICYGALKLKMWQLHAIIWFLSFLSFLLPLSSTDLGSIDDENTTWCYLRGNPTMVIIWFFVTQVSVIWISVLIMVYLWASLESKLRNDSIFSPRDSSANILAPMLKSAINGIRYYPLSLILVWLPNMLMLPLMYFKSISYFYYAISAVLATQNGTLLSLIYFIRSKEARNRMSALFSLFIRLLKYFLIAIPLRSFKLLFCRHDNSNALSPGLLSGLRQQGDGDDDDDFNTYVSSTRRDFLTNTVMESEAEHFEFPYVDDFDDVSTITHITHSCSVSTGKRSRGHGPDL